MYCRHCGREIGESDAFCKYCGKRVAVEGEPYIYRNKTMWARFCELSKWKQITIILYIICVLVWFCAILGDAREEYFFLWTIVIPFIIVALWYIYKICKKKDAGSRSDTSSQFSSTLDTEKVSAIPIAAAPSENLDAELHTAPSEEQSQIVSSELLIQFAR